MTRSDATQITVRADDLRELHPTHGIAGDLRAAQARLRHNARRAAARLAAARAADVEPVDAAFARLRREG